MHTNGQDDVDSQGEEDLFAKLRSAVREEQRGSSHQDDEPQHPRPEGYDVLGEIHRGSQGIVYRALQRSTKRLVAVKVLLFGRHADELERARFEREIKVAASLDHPAIVTVYEAGVTDGWLWYSMQLVDGERLDDFLDRGELSARERVTLLRDIGRVVAHAHENDVVHRDLKPSNVVVDGSGTPHVLDFGLAKPMSSLDDLTSLTSTGNFLGTLTYASPEQVGPASHLVDSRADVHALGVMLYEMMTGRRPFDGHGGVSSLVRTLAHEPAPDPTRFAPSMDRDLRAILLMSLAKSPEDRYRDAGELADDLTRWLDHEPVAARRPRPWRRFMAFARRRKGLATLLGTLLLGAVVATIVVDQAGDRGDRFQQAYERVLTGDLGGMGSPTPVLQAFVRAARSVDTNLPDDPMARAHVHCVVGSAFADRFELGAARYFYGSALELLRGVHGPDHAALSNPWRLLGELELRAGTTQAVDALREALRLNTEPGSLIAADGFPADGPARSSVDAADQDAHDGPESRAVSNTGLSALLARALLALESEASLTEAEDLLSYHLPRKERLHPKDRLKVLHSQGLLLLAQGQLQQARDVLEGALDQAEQDGLLADVGADQERDAPPDANTLRTPPPPTSDTAAELADLLLDLASVALLRGQQGEALAHIDLIVALSHRRHGAETLPELLWTMADVRKRRGQPHVAQLVKARALPLMMRNWAPSSVEHGPALQVLATSFDTVDEDVWSLPWLDAFVQLRRVRGVGTYQLADSANDVAILARAAGQDALAESLLQESLTIRCRSLGLDCPHRMESLLELADLQLASGETETSRAHLLEAASILTRTRAFGSTRGSIHALRVAELLERLGEFPDARQLADGMESTGALREEALWSERLAQLRQRLGSSAQ